MRSYRAIFLEKSLWKARDFSGQRNSPNLAEKSRKFSVSQGKKLFEKLRFITQSSRTAPTMMKCKKFSDAFFVSAAREQQRSCCSTSCIPFTTVRKTADGAVQSARRLYYGFGCMNPLYVFVHSKVELCKPIFLRSLREVVRRNFSP